MRVLVTGAAGYVGGWLLPALGRAGHEVVGFDVVEGDDLLARGVFDAAVCRVRPDVVVHLAARYGRVQCEDDPWCTARLNAEASTVVARVCGDRGVRLVYVSSSEVYGNPEVGGVRQDWGDTRPLNMYGLSKLWGEQVSELYAPDGLVVARLNMPYGPGGGSGVPGFVGRNALHTFLWHAVNGREIEVHPNTYRSWTWAGDMARGLVAAVECVEGGRFLVARTDQLRSSYEVAVLACRVAGVDPDRLIRLVDPPAGLTWVKHYVPYPPPGWHPMVSLWEGMKMTVDWVRGLK